jgi:hypothetical protein
MSHPALKLALAAAAPLLLLAALHGAGGASAARARAPGPRCDALERGWFPECWVAAHARIMIGDDRCGGAAATGPGLAVLCRLGCRGGRPAVATGRAPHASHAPKPPPEHQDHVINALHVRKVGRAHHLRPLPQPPTQPSAPPKKHRTMYWTPFTSEKWGNALSGYFQARALALLAGYGFDSYGGRFVLGGGEQWGRAAGAVWVRLPSSGGRWRVFGGGLSSRGRCRSCTGPASFSVGECNGTGGTGPPPPSLPPPLLLLRFPSPTPPHKWASRATRGWRTSQSACRPPPAPTPRASPRRAPRATLRPGSTPTGAPVRGRRRGA